MKVDHFVYGLFNSGSVTPFYIGVTSDIKNRMRGHNKRFPLTPEVLERCGMQRTTIENPFFSMYNFESANKREVSVHNPGTPNEMVMLSKFREENKADIIVVRNFDYDGKTYLHQLQNLYFALTGTELNYKP